MLKFLSKIFDADEVPAVLAGVGQLRTVGVADPAKYANAAMDALSPAECQKLVEVEAAVAKLTATIIELSDSKRRFLELRERAANDVAEGRASFVPSRSDFENDVIEMRRILRRKITEACEPVTLMIRRALVAAAKEAALHAVVIREEELQLAGAVGAVCDPTMTMSAPVLDRAEWLVQASEADFFKPRNSLETAGVAWDLITAKAATANGTSSKKPKN